MRPHILATLSCIAISAAANAQDRFVTPQYLHPGDKIAMVTPASAIDSVVMVKAMKKVEEHGFEPIAYPNAWGKHYGSYAANDTLRAADLMNAFADPEIKAVMCTRGGYGTARLLPLLDINVIRKNPKWLIGYSDISILHALMHQAGIVSIHGPMLAHINDNDLDDESVRLLIQMLTNSVPTNYSIEPHPYNVYGNVSGRLLGGNLLTINALAETEYDVMNIGDQEDVILFIEDVSEKIYAIERVLTRMHQSGALAKIKGLIIGEFTDYKPSKDFETMEDMFNYWLTSWGYDFPVLYGFPAGHGEPNYPLPLGSIIELDITPEAGNVKW